MSKMIFVNLPVRDLPRAKTFYEALGFTNNPQFTDETAACMVWSEAIHVMLLTHAKWRSFTSRPIPSTDASEVMLALSCVTLVVGFGLVHSALAQEATSISTIVARVTGTIIRAL